MAKKKRRKKRPVRPAATAGTTIATATKTAEERPVSARAERKEQARRERERRIKQARMRQRRRRLIRWGVALAVIGSISAFVVFQVVQGRELQARAEEAAQRAGCGTIQTSPDLIAGLNSAQIHSPPFAQGQNGIPATNGRHSSPLPSEPHVYDQPLPEANAVHNLEHGYVIIYYRADGEGAPSDEMIAALEDLANDEEKILMAPYDGLANGFDLVAWRKLQTCDPTQQAEPGDAVAVARGFIDQFRGGGLAPEPSGV